MVRVGIVGFGFMGNMHLRCYRGCEGAEVVALCDVDEARFRAGVTGNIAGTEKGADLAGLRLFTDFRAMLEEARLDAVSITLPTYLHLEYAVRALEAGLHVLCEKPMALNVAECESMIEAAEKAGTVLQIGHCIRFWPEYAAAKTLIDSGRFGAPKAATFRRLSTTPTWSWNGWIMDHRKSGGAVLDLHIHDADFIQHLFGMPSEVYTRAAIGPSGGPDHVLTLYTVKGGAAVTAEGGWMMSGAFGFEMSFSILLERATIVYASSASPTLRVFPEGSAAPFVPELAAGDGYSLEIAHFVAAAQGAAVPEVTTPQQSLKSVKLALLERRSFETGAPARIG